MKPKVCSGELNSAMKNERNPLVSIIVPIFGRQNALVRTLENLITNRYRPMELVLVNDGSADAIGQFLENFKDENQTENLSIRILFQKNQGAPVARNLGMKHATGEYIQFLDSDDFIDESKCIRQITRMREQHADLALCDFTMWYEKAGERRKFSNAARLRKVVNATAFFGCGSPLLRRSLAQKLTWNTQLTKKQDVDYFLRAALLAKKIIHIDRALYMYTRNESDLKRITASYSNSPPVFGLRIASLRACPAVGLNRFWKALAIASLRWEQLKYKIRKWAKGKNHKLQ